MEGLKDLRVPLRLANLMRDAGFVDVEHRIIPLHTCGWSTGWLHISMLGGLNSDMLTTQTKESTKLVLPIERMFSACFPLWPCILSPRDWGKASSPAASPMLTWFDRMPIQDAHLLIARARLEADNPAFKV